MEYKKLHAVSLEGPEPRGRAAESSDRQEGGVEQREAEEDQSVREILKPKREPVKAFQVRGDVLCENELQRWWVMDQLKHTSMTLIMQP